MARTRAYELIVGFAHYRPVIRHLDVYPDEPRLGERADSLPAPKASTGARHDENPHLALGLGVLLSSGTLPAAEYPGIALPLAANETPAMIRHVSAEVIYIAGSETEEAPAATLSLSPKTIPARRWPAGRPDRGPDRLPPGTPLGRRVVSSEFSQASSLVMVEANGERWRCLASNDGNVQDLSLAR